MLSLDLGPSGALTCGLRGASLLEAPIFNKGSAFPDSERAAFGLDGLLPPHVTDLSEQVERVWEELSFKSSDTEKHIYLRALQDRNEVLFYRLLLDHLEEMMPLVYTPVVGWACRHFSHIYRRPRGLFIPYPQRQLIDQILQNRPFRDVDVIVVTDGERILGLGDQGVGGMGIPIGKLSLYTLCGGIHPARTLPILLDCGTDNEERLADPYYLGWRNPRIKGDAYFEFIDMVVQAVQRALPNVLFQWEDFSKAHASTLLERYQDRLCTFNDDIQGTAAVTVAAILSALHTSGGRLSDLRVVVAGAGSAAAGIADLLVRAMQAEGMSEAEALDRFWLLNSRGLLTEGMGRLESFQDRFAKAPGAVAGWAPPRAEHYQLDEVVMAARPTVLIGVSGQPRIFTEAIVRQMASSCEHPVILPLSNPTSQAEAVPQDVIDWTEGRAIVATGSPFEPTNWRGRQTSVAQCNNSYIFPGLGLGVILCKATRVTPSMFMAAAKEVADCAAEMGGLLPPLSRIREISRRIALRVGLEAQTVGVADAMSEEELRTRIAQTMWEPAYPSLVSA
jgi:malate dehydrogenase (oxaloacetate-decarboxylating)